MEAQHVLFSQANDAFEQANFELAFTTYEKLLKDERNEKKLAFYYFKLSVIAYALGHTKLFIHYVHLHAQIITTDCAEREFLQGLLQLTHLKYSKALVHFSTSNSLCSSVKLKTLKVMSLIFILHCQLLIGDLQDARQTFHSMKHYDDTIERNPYMFVLFALTEANMYLLMHETEAFNQAIERCEGYLPFTALKKEQLFADMLRAKQLALENDYVKAIKLLHICKEQIDFYDPQLLAMLYSAFIDYYEQMQQHREALQFAKQLMQLQRKVASI